MEAKDSPWLSLARSSPGLSKLRIPLQIIECTIIIDARWQWHFYVAHGQPILYMRNDLVNKPRRIRNSSEHSTNDLIQTLPPVRSTRWLPWLWIKYLPNPNINTVLNSWTNKESVTKGKLMHHYSNRLQEKIWGY